MPLCPAESCRFLKECLKGEQCCDCTRDTWYLEVSNSHIGKNKGEYMHAVRLRALDSVAFGFPSDWAASVIFHEQTIVPNVSKMDF